MNQTELEAIKRSSEERLAALGADVNQALPLIESLDEVQPRSAQDVAGRACTIAYVIGMGYEADRSELSEQIARYGLEPWVTDHERSLLSASTLSEQDRINCTWLDECAQALAWTLGMAELDCRRHCDDDLASKFPFDADPGSFIAAARLRSMADIQREVDFHYRLHWCLRHGQLADADSAVSLSIVVERRRALDWTYGVEIDWDAVPLDT